MLCKTCRQKAGLTRAALKEKRATIDLLIALELQPASPLDQPLGFENSSQYGAIQRRIDKSDRH
jgi:hypothetical protein